MEQQAANLYTKKVFTKFQEELVETFVYTANKIERDGMTTKYRVAKYEHDDKAYIVMLNISEMQASCSCQMFEYCGILCRHILTVFTVTNILTLPISLHIEAMDRECKILDWIRGTECGFTSLDTLTSRFNNLCLEAIKYAEEGAIAIETYNAAISNLKEGGTKIASVKKSVAKVTPYRSHFSGNSQEENNKKTPTAPHEMIPSLWPWQDAMPPRFNLNDRGVPCADLNQPSMAPVSIHRDGGPTDNSVVLTYFKSMTWVIENKTLTPDGKVAVINLKVRGIFFTEPLIFVFRQQLHFTNSVIKNCNNLLEFLWVSGARNRSRLPATPGKLAGVEVCSFWSGPQQCTLLHNTEFNTVLEDHHQDSATLLPT
ncbi:hypothetical protein NC652_020084 [Populus alba x Populus x berolinensis]|nr:hypothetical protein NC652_020084 [Populus alba x Populus x berolinensis]